MCGGGLEGGGLGIHLGGLRREREGGLAEIFEVFLLLLSLIDWDSHDCPTASV